jgi:Fibronectin type III domain
MNERKKRVTAGLTAAIAIGVLLLLLTSGLGTTLTLGQSTSGGGRTSPIDAQYAPANTTTSTLLECDAVTSCVDPSFAVPAYTTVVAIVAAESSVDPTVHESAFSAHEGGLFFRDNQYVKESSKSYGGIEVQMWMSNYTLSNYSGPVWVNFTHTATTYMVGLIDVAGIAANDTTLNVTVGGTGSNTGNSTGATCPITTTANGETVISASYVSANESNLLSSHGVPIDRATQGAYSFIDNYQNVTTAGAVTPAPTNSFPTGARWDTACIGFIQQLVPNAPSNVVLTGTSSSIYEDGPAWAGLRWTNSPGSTGSVYVYAAAATFGANPGCDLAYGVGGYGPNQALMAVLPSGTTSAIIGGNEGTGSNASQATPLYLEDSVCFLVEDSYTYGHSPPGWIGPVCIACEMAFAPTNLTEVSKVAVNSTYENVTVNFTYENPWNGISGDRATVNDIDGYDVQVATYSGGSCGAFSTAKQWGPYESGGQDQATTASATIMGAPRSDCFRVVPLNSGNSQNRTIAGQYGYNNTPLPSLPSVPVVVNVTEPVTHAPTGLSASLVNATGLTLSWTNPSTGGPFTNNTIYQGTGSGCSYSKATSIVPAGTTYVVSGLTPSTVYCFGVAVANASGESSVSASITKTTSPVPNAPTGLTAAAAGATYIVWEWANPTNSVLTDSYLFYKQSGSCTSGVTEVNIGSVATYYNLTGLTGGDEYCAYVEAASGASVSAGSSHQLEYTLPSAPTHLSGTSAIGAVNLTWTNPSGTLTNTYVFYALYSGSTCGTYTEIVVGASVSTYYVSGLNLLPPDNTYCFYVEAVNSAGSSPASSVIEKATL